MAGVDVWNPNGSPGSDEIVFVFPYQTGFRRPDICERCSRDQLLHSLGNPGQALVWEGRNPVKDTWFLNQDRAIRWVDGRIVHLQVATDITRLKQLQADQLKAEVQLRQTQKMESIGTLAGGIAHDFNNILYPLVGNAEMLREDLPPDSPLRECVDEMFQAAMRARRFVKRILTVSRQGDPDVKPIRVQPILKEALRILRDSIPKTIEMRQQIDSGCDIIIADPTQIHQIVMNLATNAYHAMDYSGGILTVSLSQVHLAAEADQLALAPGDYARLTVSDTGSGMAPHLLEKIFDPYFTTKEKGRGTGLGLSVVHGIVKSCNGQIQVKSAPGRERESRSPGCPDAVSGGHERLLLVDDEEAVLRMERRVLERLGYQVVAQNSGISALAAFRTAPDAFDLVVTDMTMPGLTGVHLAQEVRHIRPRIPIIICTGYSDHLDLERARAMGLQGFVMKPMIKGEIASAIRRALAATGEAGVEAASVRAL